MNPNVAATTSEELEQVTISSADEPEITPPQQQTVANLVSPQNTTTYKSMAPCDLSSDMGVANEHTVPINAVVGDTRNMHPAQPLTPIAAETAVANTPHEAVANTPQEEPIDIDIDIDEDPPDLVANSTAAVAGFVPAPIPPNPRPVTLPGSPKKIWPNRVTVVTTPGTMIAFLHLPKDRTRGVHESCLTRIENSEAYLEIKKQFHFFSFPPWYPPPTQNRFSSTTDRAAIVTKTDTVSSVSCTSKRISTTSW